MKVFNNTFIKFLMLILIVPSLICFAGTTGKITGKVTDAVTGDPLPSVNILVKGTATGTATDANGNYVILNLKPGKYTLIFSMIGYGSKTVESIIVNSDLTTKIDVKLKESGVELASIVVKAKKMIIRKDVTTRTAIVSSKTFDNLPVASFQDVVSLQAGFTEGSNGELHARGGRSDEIVYLVDGIPDKNPINGSFNGQLDKNVIQELQVLTGGFNAEYGQALSGVVNIVTKDGGDKYKGRVEFISDELNTSPYHSADALAYDQWGLNSDGKFVERVNSEGTGLITNDPSAYKTQSLNDTPDLGLDMNVLGTFSGVLSGAIPFVQKLKFFLTVRYQNVKNQLPWGYNKERELNFKLSYPIFQGMKISYYLHRDYRLYKPYSHAWKYYPQGYEDRKNFTWKDNIIINHVLSNSTFYNLAFSYLRNYFNRFTPGKFAEFTNDGQLISSNYLRKNNNTPPFWTNADNGIFIKNDVKTYILKFDLSSQLGMHNLIKTGFEFQSHSIGRLSFAEPYAGGFHAYTNYKKYPLEFSLYAQDKMEFDVFILNFGLRFDYADVKDTQWPDVTTPAGFLNDKGIFVPDGEIKTPAKYQFSPRLGISFPITEKTIFYSSYGHFFQLPNFTDMYSLRDPTLDRALVGNPGVKPQKTISFEVGFKQQIGSFYSIDLSAYFKNITNLMGSTYYTKFPYEYTIFNNSDYGEVKGFEINLTKAPSDYWYANVNYTFSIAQGNESDPREGYNNYRRANALLRPKREFPLSFDRRNTLSASLGLNFPANFGPLLLGMHFFENIDIYLVARYSSGLPYTPRPTEESEGLIVDRNSNNMAATQQVDLRFLKMFPLLGATKLSLFLSVLNVFDSINPVNVWSTSGDPWDAGPTSSRTLDRQRNPSNIGLRRTIKLGIRFDF